MLQEMNLPHFDCRPNLVEKQLKDLRISKAPSPEGIHHRVDSGTGFSYCNTTLSLVTSTMEVSPFLAACHFLSNKRVCVCLL